MDKISQRNLKITHKKLAKDITIILIPFIFTVIISLFLLSERGNTTTEQLSNFIPVQGSTPSCIEQEFTQFTVGNDQDDDGIDDQIDILESAKERLNHEVKYIDKAYTENEGKPPDNEGVCTDLFWRSLEGAGFDFQEIIYEDMVQNPDNYPLEIWNMSAPEKTIDFRRVPNIEAYLNNHAETLPLEITSCDFASLNNWQGGDIVIFSLDGTGPSDHIAIVSNERDSEGIPYLIHNWGIGPEMTTNTSWYPKIVGHYRWKSENID